MSSKKNSKVRTSKDANPKKFKKKTSILVTDKVEYIDYKDVNLLTRFVSDRSKIRNRRVTGNDVQQQREIANAVKNAREMALLPYTKRVSQTRTSRAPRDGDSRRSERSEEQVVSQVESTEVKSTEVESTEVETAEVVDEIVEA